MDLQNVAVGMRVVVHNALAPGMSHCGEVIAVDHQHSGMCQVTVRHDVGCERLGTDWAHAASSLRPELPARHVFQDGAAFYVGDESETHEVVTAPMRVADMDMEAAEQARDWFVMVYAPQAGFLPMFTADVEA
jgi:hypothetical protein